MSSNFQDLRAKALDQLINNPVDTTQWGNDIKKLIEELSIHQIELEYQNEELVRAQADLQRTTDEYADLFDNAPVGHVIIDTDYLLIRANNTFCNTLFLSKEEVIGNNFYNYVHPLFQDTFYHFYKLLQKGDSSAQVDLKLRSSRRGDVYVRIDGTSENGNRFFRFAITNISLQKKLEDKLRKETEKVLKSETQFRQIVEMSSDVFYYQNVKTRRMEYVSPTIFNLLGFTQDDIIRKSNLELIASILPNYREDYINLVDTLLENSATNGTNTISKESQMFNKNNEVVWVRGTYTLITNNIGEPYQILGTLHNISNNKKYEEELLQAKEKAEENDRLKTSFLANMSHEIRTPLNAIIGFANVMKESLSEKDGEEENLEYVSIIENNGQKLLSIINDLIYISKIEANQVIVRNTTFDINKLLSDTYLTFELEAEKKGLILKNLNGNEPLFITTDKDKVNSCLSNLVKNALKYTEKGYIEYEASVDAKNILHISVKDSGIGIPSDKKGIIFSRFSQINQTNTNDGVGLGLSIVKGTLDLLGGTVSFKSKVGSGSTFSFTIPLQ